MCFHFKKFIYNFFKKKLNNDSQDNKDVWKLVFGKHNLTSPISLFSRPEVIVKSQSYYFTHSVKTIAVTSTAKGITSKQLLIGTIGDQVGLKYLNILSCFWWWVVFIYLFINLMSELHLFSIC